MNMLVCLDGEPHTDAAIERAIGLAKYESAEISGLHVVDTWLRQFSSEIYAQGRAEYLDYVDVCLAAEAAQIRRSFTARCNEQGLSPGFTLRHGDPLTEILSEVRESAPDLVVTGGKLLSAWGRFRSRNLPGQLKKKLAGQTSVIALKSSAQGTSGLSFAACVTPSASS